MSCDKIVSLIQLDFCKLIWVEKCLTDKFHGIKHRLNKPLFKWYFLLYRPNFYSNLLKEWVYLCLFICTFQWRRITNIYRIILTFLYVENHHLLKHFTGVTQNFEWCEILIQNRANDRQMSPILEVLRQLFGAWFTLTKIFFFALFCLHLFELVHICVTIFVPVIFFL